MIQPETVIQFEPLVREDGVELSVELASALRIFVMKSSPFTVDTAQEYDRYSDTSGNFPLAHTAEGPFFRVGQDHQVACA